jgi:hypothetical protein
VSSFYTLFALKNVIQAQRTKIYLFEDFAEKKGVIDNDSDENFDEINVSLITEDDSIDLVKSLIILFESHSSAIFLRTK